MTLQEQHAKHMRAAEQLYERLGLPPSDATALAWFDGSHRKIVLWIKTRAIQRAAIQIPLTFDGYPVEVERYRTTRPLGAEARS